MHVLFFFLAAVETVDRDEDKLTREDLEKEVSDGNNVPSDFFIS